MGQAYSRGAKLRAKRAASSLPGLAEVPKKQPNGRTRRSRSDLDAATPAYEARCRQMGLKPSKDAVRAAKAEWNGCRAGRAMAAAVSNDEDRSRLWGAIQHMRRVQVAHDRAIGAPNRHPKCMSLMVASGWGFVGDRTDEEIQRRATSELMALETWLGYTDKAAASEARRVVIDDVRPRDVKGLLLALRCVADGIAGQPLVWRGK